MSDALAEGERLPDGEPDAEARLRVAPRARDGDTEAEMLAEPLAEMVVVSEAVCEGVSEPLCDGEPEAEGLSVLDALTVVVMLGDPDPEFVPLPV